MKDFVEANGTSFRMTDGAAKVASDHKEFKQAYKDLKKYQKSLKKVQIRSSAKSTPKIEEAWLR